MRFAFSAIALLAAVASASPLAKRDVSQVKADISQISTKATALDNSIKAFPDSGGTLVQALAIHNAAVDLDNTVKNATTDANAVTTPFSEADGRSILDSVEAIEPTIDDALKNIAAKKPAFDALPLGGVSNLAKQDLANLDTDTTAFANALLKNTPADLVDEATQLRDRIHAAFTTARAAYGG